MPVWFSTWFWPCIFGQDAKADKNAWLLQALQMSKPAVVGWQDSLIGPGGLPFVVSHLFAVPDLVL
jgi:hypothetical protein